MSLKKLGKLLDKVVRISTMLILSASIWMMIEIIDFLQVEVTTLPRLAIITLSIILIKRLK